MVWDRELGRDVHLLQAIPYFRFSWPYLVGILAEYSNHCPVCFRSMIFIFCKRELGVGRTVALSAYKLQVVRLARSDIVKTYPYVCEEVLRFRPHSSSCDKIIERFPRSLRLHLIFIVRDLFADALCSVCFLPTVELDFTEVACTYCRLNILWPSW